MNESDKQNPFQTPDGYFEKFTDRLMSKMEQEVSGLPEGDGFVVPEHYFEGLHQSILQKLDAETKNTETAKVIALHPYRKYYYAVASIAAIALLVFALNQKASEETYPENNTLGAIGFDDLANTDIEDYFDDDNLDFSTYDIAEVLPVDELDVSDILSEQIKDEPILEYLDNNTDNFDELDYEYDEQPD